MCIAAKRECAFLEGGNLWPAWVKCGDEFDPNRRSGHELASKFERMLIQPWESPVNNTKQMLFSRDCKVRESQDQFLEFDDNDDVVPYIVANCRYLSDNGPRSWVYRRRRVSAFGL